MPQRGGICDVGEGWSIRNWKRDQGWKVNGSHATALLPELGAEFHQLGLSK